MLTAQRLLGARLDSAREWLQRCRERKDEALAFVESASTSLCQAECELAKSLELVLQLEKEAQSESTQQLTHRNSLQDLGGAMSRVLQDMAASGYVPPALVQEAEIHKTHVMQGVNAIRDAVKLSTAQRDPCPSDDADMHPVPMRVREAVQLIDAKRTRHSVKVSPSAAEIEIHAQNQQALRAAEQQQQVMLQQQFPAPQSFAGAGAAVPPAAGSSREELPEFPEAEGGGTHAGQSHV